MIEGKVYIKAKQMAFYNYQDLIILVLEPFQN